MEEGDEEILGISDVRLLLRLLLLSPGILRSEGFLGGDLRVWGWHGRFALLGGGGNVRDYEKLDVERKCAWILERFICCGDGTDGFL